MEKGTIANGKKMPIKDFKESEIRTSIINKIKPTIRKGNSPHQKGKVFINGKVEAIVKIPNNHSKVMKERKSKYIAGSLKLQAEEFNSLIDCTLSGPGYYKILEELVSNSE